jgi:hypothetical protein
MHVLRFHRDMPAYHMAQANQEWRKASIATFRRKIDVFANSDTDGRCRQCRTKETTSPGAAGEVVKEESNMD